MADEIEYYAWQENSHPLSADRKEAQDAYETVPQEAQRLVYGDRNDAYGHPYDDYTRTGAMWGAILAEWAVEAAEAVQSGHPPIPVPPGLAVLCMAAVKISREVNSPKRDNMVDLAGYATCKDRVNRHEKGEE